MQIGTAKEELRRLALAADVLHDEGLENVHNLLLLVSRQTRGFLQRVGAFCQQVRFLAFLIGSRVTNIQAEKVLILNYEIEKQTGPNSPPVALAALSRVQSSQAATSPKQP